jgi:hypothetical protein
MSKGRNVKSLITLIKEKLKNQKPKLKTIRKWGVWSTRRPKGIRRGGGIIHFTRTGLRSGGYYYLFYEHTNGVRRAFLYAHTK